MPIKQRPPCANCDKTSETHIIIKCSGLLCAVHLCRVCVEKVVNDGGMYLSDRFIPMERVRLVK